MIKVIIMSVFMALSLKTGNLTETTSQLEEGGWECVNTQYEDHKVIQEWKTDEGGRVDLGYYM